MWIQSEDLLGEGNWKKGLFKWKKIVEKKLLPSDVFSTLSNFSWRDVSNLFTCFLLFREKFYSWTGLLENVNWLFVGIVYWKSSLNFKFICDNLLSHVLFLKQYPQNYHSLGISKMWSAFFVLSILS